jgi:hypothetical protein
MSLPLAAARNNSRLFYLLIFMIRFGSGPLRTCPVLYFAPTCIVGYHVFTGLGMASSRRRGRLCKLWGLNPLLDLALGLCWHHFTACRCLRLFFCRSGLVVFWGAEVTWDTWDTWDVVMHAPTPPWCCWFLSGRMHAFLCALWFEGIALGDYL